MKSNYARRLAEIEPFRVMKLLARANELEAQGHDVIHMEVGEPDFATPEPIVVAGVEALRQGETRYTAANGILPLREAISAYYLQQYRLAVDPNRIFVTAGASGALLLISALLINHGDGLLMTDPGYPCNRHMLKAFHGEGQLVPVTAASNYQLTAELIRSHWVENTRGVLLASPANPTGAVLSANDLESIVGATRMKQGYLVVDEIYQGLTYGEGGSSCALQITDDVFIINSFSKYFGMTGWRLGWLISPADAQEEIEKLAQNLFICPSTIAQHAAIGAFSSEALGIMEDHRQEFARRRDFLLAGLRELGFSVPVEPEGAIYIYARLPSGAPPSEQFCHDLLEQQLVAITPGTDFGFYLADEHVRFTYAENIGRLAEALTRIGSALG